MFLVARGQPAAMSAEAKYVLAALAAVAGGLVVWHGRDISPGVAERVDAAAASISMLADGSLDAGPARPAPRGRAGGGGRCGAGAAALLAAVTALAAALAPR